ncbi:hypothetical protein GF324_04715 [bacterium]|nr:hypothetical protein [bacterium]
MKALYCCILSLSLLLLSLGCEEEGSGGTTGPGNGNNDPYEADTLTGFEDWDDYPATYYIQACLRNPPNPYYDVAIRYSKDVDLVSGEIQSMTFAPGLLTRDEQARFQALESVEARDPFRFSFIMRTGESLDTLQSRVNHPHTDPLPVCAGTSLVLDDTVEVTLAEADTALLLEFDTPEYHWYTCSIERDHYPTLVYIKQELCLIPPGSDGPPFTFTLTVLPGVSWVYFDPFEAERLGVVEAELYGLSYVYHVNVR